jgi:ATP synthase protein I
MLRQLGRPILTVLRWQILATVALAAVAGAVAGVHGALSASAGGLVSILSGLAAAILASRGGEKSAGGVVIGALRAEGVRVVLIVILLWLVMTTYRDVVVIAFFGSFLVTVIIFAMAFFVRES